MEYYCQQIAFNIAKKYNEKVVKMPSRLKGTRGEHRCPCCNTGHMKMFYLGYDAATAVLGTELFEQLPENETVLKSKSESETSSGGLFSMAIAAKPVVETVKKKRQFLSFSDSRSEAAFFASYMTSFYKEFLRRRGIWHVIEKNKDSINRNLWEVTTLVDELNWDRMTLHTLISLKE